MAIVRPRRVGAACLLVGLLALPLGGPRATDAAALAAPYNVAFALSLPYTVVVTEMGMGDYTAMKPVTKKPAMGMGAAPMSSGIRTLGGRLLATGSMAHGIAFLPGTRDVFVSDFLDGTVEEVDLATMRVLRTFTVGLSPTHIVFTPDHARAFVSNLGSNDESVLDLRTGAVRTISFPHTKCFRPHGLTFSADAQTLYVACSGGAWIHTIDVKTLRPGSPIITGAGAYDVKLDRQRQELWVPNQLADTISVLDSRTLRELATITLAKGSGPALLDIAPDGRRAYVVNLLGNSVSAIDTASRKVLATIPVAAQPFGPAITPDGRYVYAPGIKGNAVTIIRTSDLKVVAVVPAPVGPVQVAIQ